MTFHAVKRSMRMSEGRRSFGAMFFLMSDCCLDTAEPALLLPLEIDVALDNETLSFMAASMVVAVVVVEGKRDAHQRCDDAPLCCSDARMALRFEPRQAVCTDQAQAPNTTRAGLNSVTSSQKRHISTSCSSFIFNTSRPSQQTGQRGSPY